MTLRSWIRDLFACLAPRPIRKAPPRARLAVEMLERREVLDASTQWLIGGGSSDLAQTFLLHSNPTAQQVIYLDFDGHTTGAFEQDGVAFPR